VDGSSGAFTQQIQIDAPPGRNGLQPNLSLQCSSQNTSDSMVGYGWSLSIPYIQRLNKTGSQDLYNVNTFTSSAEGELVASTTQATTTAYMARVDNGSFNAYTFAGNTWTVYDESGTRYLYGSDDSGRQYDTGTGTSTQTYMWYLQEVRDTNGNYIKYTYLRDNNQIYPSQIIYTGNGSTDGPAKITFATSTRTDVRASCASDFKVTTNYRISEIDSLFNGTTVRKYLLGYGVGDNGARSLLTSLQQEGYDDSNNLTALPAMTFTYATTSTAFYAPSSSGIYGQASVISDVNGDGVNDVNVFYQDAFHVPNGRIYSGGQSTYSSVSPQKFGPRRTPAFLFPMNLGRDMLM
jgi:hypothetical protein